MKLSNRLQQGSAARACAAWIRQKVEIRSIRQANLLHGKMVHIATGRGSDGTTVAEAILGSSNFTLSGLGLAHAHNNIELNLVVDNRRDRQDLLAWFDALWNDTRLVEDVRDEVLAYLAQLYQDNTPEFIYFKTLFHLFEAYLSEQAQSSLLAIQQQIVDTDIWKALFEFQKDGVKGAINKMLAYNGCILADSVGLGKTYEALAIIKYFELRNERVLVLCPKKLRDNWTVYQAHNNSDLNPFGRDRFRYTVLSHTDLSRDGGHSGDVDLAALNWGNYDLVVIDESHNFRNNAPGRKDERRADQPQPLSTPDGGHHPGRRPDQGAAALGHAGQQHAQGPAQPDLLHHREPGRRAARLPRHWQHPGNLARGATDLQRLGHAPR
ncbi:SNF2-related protein [Candidatus Amarolinea dominans]|uniref:SNF2-related protein n=1 Tax=Candidatus Amarolinea dominans TaxID=3140696 RepID=UPI0031CC869D